MLPSRNPDVVKNYQLTNLTNNNNKWWKIEWWIAEQIANITYGRVGQDCARPALKTGIDQRKFDKLIRDREKPKDEGTYREVKVGQVVATNADTSGLSNKLVNRIQRILAAANENIGNFLLGGVENLSLDQIAEGKEQLQKIVAAKSKKLKDAELLHLVQHYYNLIPTKLPYKIDPMYVVNNLVTNAADEEDKLLQLEAAIQGVKISTSGGSLLDQLGCKLWDVDAAEYDAAVNYYTTTQRHAGRDAKVKEVWRVEIPVERTAFEQHPVKTNIKRLFHGTRDANVRHILRSGLIIPKNAANGSMYGRGIYLADVSTKSLGYCGYSYQNNEKYMFLVDAKLGNMYTTHSTGSWTEPPKGYDSIFAPAGKQNGAYSGYLGFNEYMVYRKEQQSIQYLLVLE